MVLPEPSCVAFVAVAALQAKLPVALRTHLVVAIFVVLSVVEEGVGALVNGFPEESYPTPISAYVLSVVRPL